MPATYDTEWSCDLFKVDAAKQRELEQISPGLNRYFPGWFE